LVEVPDGLLAHEVWVGDVLTQHHPHHLAGMLDRLFEVARPLVHAFEATIGLPAWPDVIAEQGRFARVSGGC